MEKEKIYLDQVSDPKPYPIKYKRYLCVGFTALLITLIFGRSIGLTGFKGAAFIFIAVIGENFFRLHDAKKSGNSDYPVAMMLSVIAIFMIAAVFLSTIFFSKKVYAPMCFFGSFLISILQYFSVFLAIPRKLRKIRPDVKFILIFVAICYLICIVIGLRALIMGEFA